MKYIAPEPYTHMGLLNIKTNDLNYQRKPPPFFWGDFPRDFDTAGDLPPFIQKSICHVVTDKAMRPGLQLALQSIPKVLDRVDVGAQCQ